MAVAVRVVMVEPPPTLSVAPAPWVNPPVPERAVPTESVPLLFSVTPAPVTVTLVIEKVPVRVCEAVVSKVCTPVPPINVGVLVMPPRNVTGELIVLFQVPFALIVSNPVKILVPVAEVIFKMPLLPAPTVVVPVTVRLKPAAPKVAPSPIPRLPPMVRFAPLVAVADPVKVKLLLTVAIAPKTSGPPLKVRW